MKKIIYIVLLIFLNSCVNTEKKFDNNSIQELNDTHITTIERLEYGITFSNEAYNIKVNSELIFDKYNEISKTIQYEPITNRVEESINEFADTLILVCKTLHPLKGKWKYLIDKIDDNKLKLISNLDSKNKKEISYNFEVFSNYIFQLLLTYKLESELSLGKPKIFISDEREMSNGKIELTLISSKSDSDFTETYLYFKEERIYFEKDQFSKKIIVNSNEIKNDSLKITLTQRNKTDHTYFSYNIYYKNKH